MLFVELLGTKKGKMMEIGSKWFVSSNRTGFNVTFAQTNHSWGRFGSGLYFAPNSSKSHDYVHTKGNVKVMILCKVAAGKVFKTKVDMPNLRCPPSGYDSVSGEVGGNLNYAELVVYASDASLPSYILFYQ